MVHAKPQKRWWIVDLPHHPLTREPFYSTPGDPLAGKKFVPERPLEQLLVGL